MTTKELIVHLKTPHDEQRKFIESSAKRKIIRAGRRSGKTTGLSMQAVDVFLDGHRVLYAAPTSDQTDKFWLEVSTALRALVQEGLLRLNQTSRFIERRGTENRIKAKTAWDADTLRGDYADFLILDEFQQMDPKIWDDVGAPMLLDNDGDAVFIYTPPRPGELVKGPHAQKMFKRAKADKSGRYAAFHFTSHDNPHISEVALAEIIEDMSDLAYRREIMAEDIEDHPDAQWSRDVIERYRIDEIDDLEYIVIPVDPPATVGTCGIVPCGRKTLDGVAHAFVLSDVSLRGKPGKWAGRVVNTYHQLGANYIIGEINNGGDMIENTIKNVPDGDKVAYKQVRASRGKSIRAEPIASLYAQGRIHHVGDSEKFRELEDQMCNWIPGMSKSPDRLDSMVYGCTELLLLSGGWARGIG
jgi:hypothetical protein